MARHWSETALETLDVLFWGMEVLRRPMGHPPFEAWQRRYGSLSAIARLERAHLLQREKHAKRLVYHVTDLGRLMSLGGRHPEQQWQRPWDGQWRMLIFDLPAGQKAVRGRLLRWLRRNGFGYLQDSVWIHPNPIPELADALREFRYDVESCTLLEAHCCAGYNNAALVSGAWKFELINKRYETLISQAEGLLRHLPAPSDRELLQQRLREQRRGWRNATEFDPFLPQTLHPRDYLGPRAWDIHREVMSRLAMLLLASSSY